MSRDQMDESQRCPALPSATQRYIDVVVARVVPDPRRATRALRMWPWITRR